MVAPFVFSFLRFEQLACSSLFRLSFEHSDIISMVDKSAVHRKLFQFDNWNLECWFLGKGENRSTQRKTSWSKERTNSKFNPLPALMQLPPPPQYTKSLEVSLKLLCCCNSLFSVWNTRMRHCMTKWKRYQNIIYDLPLRSQSHYRSE